MAGGEGERPYQCPGCEQVCQSVFVAGASSCPHCGTQVQLVQDTGSAAILQMLSAALGGRQGGTTSAGGGSAGVLAQLFGGGAASRESMSDIRKTNAKGTAQTARHSLGLSNFQCRVLGPVFTHYRPSKERQESVPFVRQMSAPPGAKGHLPLEKLRSTFAIDPEHLDEPGFGKDRAASSYLSNMLAGVMEVNHGKEVIAALHADGDGHCLVHSLSRCIVGQEVYWHALRTGLHHRLTVDKAWYLQQLPQFEEMWDEVVAEAEPDFCPPPGEALGLRPLHVFGLANALRRPIILFDGVGGQVDGTSAVFLPFQHSAQDCYKRPIAIAWANAAHGHFVSVCPVQTTSPTALQSLHVSGAVAGLAGDKTYRATVPYAARRITVTPRVNGRVPCLVPEACLPWDAENQQPLVWGAESPQHARVLVDAYIDFFDTDAGARVFELGGGPCMDLSPVVKIMDRRFHEEHEFDTEFAQAAYMGIEAEMGEPFAMTQPVDKVLGLVRQLRSEVFFCTHCCRTTVSKVKVHGSCGRCNALLVYSLSNDNVRCPVEVCGATTPRVSGQLAAGEVKVTDPCRCGAGDESLRRYDEDAGGFVLENGDRSRTATVGGAGCCTFKHVWSADGRPVLDRCEAYDFVPEVWKIKLDDGDGKPVTGTCTWIGDDTNEALHSSAKDIARQLVRQHLPRLSGTRRHAMEVKVQKTVQGKADVLSQARCLHVLEGKAAALAQRARARVEESQSDDFQMDMAFALSLDRPFVSGEEASDILEEARSHIAWSSVQHLGNTSAACVACTSEARGRIATLERLSARLAQGSGRCEGHADPASLDISVDGHPVADGKPSPWLPVAAGEETVVTVSVTDSRGGQAAAYSLVVLRGEPTAEERAREEAQQAAKAARTAKAARQAELERQAQAEREAERARARQKMASVVVLKIVLPSSKTVTVELSPDSTTAHLHAHVQTHLDAQATFTLHHGMADATIPCDSEQTLLAAKLQRARVKVRLTPAASAAGDPQSTPELSPEAAGSRWGAGTARGAASGGWSPLTAATESLPALKRPKTRAPETRAPETRAPETRVPGTKAPWINPVDLMPGGRFFEAAAASEGGLTETSLFCFADLPATALFYDSGLGRLVLEDPSVDAQRGGRLYRYFTCRGPPQPWGSYSLPTLRRLYIYSPQDDEFMRADELLGLTSLLQQAEAIAAGRDTATTAAPRATASMQRVPRGNPTSDAGPGRRLGSRKDAAEATLGAVPEFAIATSLATAMQDAGTRRWRSELAEPGSLPRTGSQDSQGTSDAAAQGEPADEPGPGLTRQASIGELIDGGLLTRTLSDPPQ